jgi:membrane protein involved in colicin uptake
MTEKKMKLIAEETDRLNKKLEKLKQVEKEMKATNTEAFDAEKLSRYNSSLNQTQSAMLRTQAQLNQLAIQRQDAEKKAAAEAVARAEAEHQAEERVARKRQENEERIRREYEKSYQLYISIAEAERQADERRQAERLAAEEAARAQIKALATGGYKDIAQGVTKLNTALTQAVRTAAMLEVVLLRVGSNAVKTGAAFDASMSQVAATLNIEQVVHQQESAFARLRNAAI